MKKLSQFKEWLSLTDAAKYLNIILGEEVSTADVLQLAIDGRLTLSIWLTTPIPAKAVTLTTLRSSLEKLNLANHESGAPLSDKLDLLRPISNTDNTDHWHAFGKSLEKYWSWRRENNLVENFLQTGDRICIAEGVDDLRGLYDLPMIGGERLDVESELSLLLGGEECETTCISGCFLKSPTNDCIYQIQTQNPDHAPNNQPGADDSDSFLPQMTLTGLGVWVVRTEALRSFDPTEHETSFSSTKEKNLLRAIAILAWLLSEQKSACRIAGRPNAKAIGEQVADLARTAFGEDIRGFDSFHKKVAEALKSFDTEELAGFRKK